MTESGPAGVDPCRDALRGVRDTWPSGTELIVIEVHDRGVQGVCDLVAYPMDRTATQVAGDYQIVARDCPVPVLGEDEFNNVEAMSEHVGQCWADVGIQVDLPAFVAPHDHWQSFDVRLGRWVADSEVYDA